MSIKPFDEITYWRPGTHDAVLVSPLQLFPSLVGGLNAKSVRAHTITREWYNGLCFRPDVVALLLAALVAVNGITANPVPQTVTTSEIGGTSTTSEMFHGVQGRMVLTT
ncbi:predicted protein [Postia placenta Mad-698-R]|nr:predicted protein [Postia placenta Mad-698-R]